MFLNALFVLVPLSFFGFIAIAAPVANCNWFGGNSFRRHVHPQLGMASEKLVEHDV